MSKRFKNPNMTKEFMIGLKPTKWAQLYSFLALLRRTAFWAWLIFAQSLSPQRRAIGFVLIQGPYFVYILLSRPYQNIPENFYEVINEIFLTLISLWWCYFVQESDWSPTLSKILMFTVFANIAITSLASLIFWITTGWKKIFNWGKKAIQPRKPKTVCNFLWFFRLRSEHKNRPRWWRAAQMIAWSRAPSPEIT